MNFISLAPLRWQVFIDAESRLMATKRVRINKGLKLSRLHCNDFENRYTHTLSLIIQNNFNNMFCQQYLHKTIKFNKVYKG